MTHASCLSHTEFPTQPRQGIGARLVRRLGGTVRSVIAGGLAHAGVLRPRSAASQSDTARDPVAREAGARTAPGQTGVPRRRAASPVPPCQPARPGLPARWLGRRPAALRRRPPCPDTDIVCFTPEAFPALTPDACAFLNTPLEQCDPDTLLFMFSGLVQHLTDLPEGADTPDPMELFATLWARLGELRAGTAPHAPPAEAPAPQQAAPAAAMPPAPIVARSSHSPAQTHPPVEAPSALPMASHIPLTEAWLSAPSEASQPPPRVPPPPAHEMPPADSPRCAAIVAAAAPATARAIVSIPQHIPRDCRAAPRRNLPGCNFSLRYRTVSACCHGIRWFRRCHALSRAHLPQRLGSRHWSYAARASPA